MLLLTDIQFSGRLADKQAPLVLLTPIAAGTLNTPLTIKQHNAAMADARCAALRVKAVTGGSRDLSVAASISSRVGCIVNIAAVFESSLEAAGATQITNVTAGPVGGPGPVPGAAKFKRSGKAQPGRSYLVT